MNVGANWRKDTEHADPFLDFKVTGRPVQPKLAIGFVNMRRIVIEQVDYRTKWTIKGGHHKHKQSTGLKERGDGPRYIL